MKVWQLVIVGVFVHVILFYSIFDIYFTSPLVHGMTPLTATSQVPATRLILFVADGLRADKFFEPDESGKSRVPYLRKIIEEDGVWGVSHTRVPTESRPGHVALIAGFYEDVSAVAKGWKENPVDFDSVFNQSRRTWSWGSPDILPMFAKGASGDHVITNCYPADLEDFAGSDMTQLDTWVFDQVKEFIASASNNLTLDATLRQDKIVMFLHLLGIDTHGHSNKPHSREYLNNIQVVDKGIQQIVGILNDFYKNDGRTVFILTADHGMTDWGSHGAGHPQETLTPFLAWGPGVRKPVVQEQCGNFEDTFCADWHLDSLRRSDMEQADIAPLMSYLIGVPLPVNSVGVLPIDVLNVSDTTKAEALLANARQLLAQFQVKMTQIKERTLSFTFRPFQDLDENRKVKALEHIQQLIDVGRSQDAILEAHNLIRQALQGLRYYQTYDRLFLGVSIVMGFLGWMSYILHLVIAEHTSLGRQAFSASTPDMRWSQVTQNSIETVSLLSFGGSAIGCGLLVGVCTTITLLLYVQCLPMMYYVYCLLPALLWFKSLQGWSILSPAIKSLLSNNGFPWNLLLSCLCCLAGLEITVQSFYRRELLSLGLLAMSAWPLGSFIGFSRRSGQSATIWTFTVLGWSLACLLVAVFPLLPVVGRNSQYSLVFGSGILAFIGGAIILNRMIKVSTVLSPHILVFQLVLVVTSVTVVAITSWSISQKFGLPLLCQLTSWATLGVSAILPLLTGTNLEERLFSLGLAFFSAFLLMSITYEGLFMLSLLALLYFWMRIEMETSASHGQKSFNEVDLAQVVSTEIKDHSLDSRLMRTSDLRRAFFYVFFIIVAFFGTGNIASINSFDPSSVYCFLTVFNPFIMGALMMLKNLLPFLLVTCALRAVHVCTQTPMRALFLLVLIMSDFMGLHFFFLVRDHGSWLEIGTTISHYVIVMAMITFLLVLTGVSHALTCWSITLPWYMSSERLLKQKRQKPYTRC